MMGHFTLSESLDMYCIIYLFWKVKIRYAVIAAILTTL